MRLVRKAILGEAHILMNAVCALLDANTLHRRIKLHYSINEFLDNGVEMSTRLLILTLMSIEPRLIVVRLQRAEICQNRFHLLTVIDKFLGLRIS